jgi:hypothetical protein
MKTLFLLFISVFALLIGGCVEQPLISDEEYNAMRGPAPYSPDPTAHIPQRSNPQSGGGY